MPGTIVQPYLFFGGRCEEALAFYRDAIGAETDMMLRFSDSPEPMPEGKLPPGHEKKIMHAQFRVGDALLMASDGCNSEASFAGFSLSLSVPTVDAAKRAFDRLSAGGKVEMPLDRTFWSPCFGMLTDRFGIGWMVSVAAESK